MVPNLLSSVDGGASDFLDAYVAIEPVGTAQTTDCVEVDDVWIGDCDGKAAYCGP